VYEEVVGVNVGDANFLNRYVLIGTIHFISNFYSSIKTVGATVLGGLWASEWAWHPAESNLHCARSSGICTPNFNSLALLVSDIFRVIVTLGKYNCLSLAKLKRFKAELRLRGELEWEGSAMELWTSLQKQNHLMA